MSRSSAREAALAAGLVALVAFLPFLRPALAGEAFFFRDLSRQFFPLRAFAVDGLRSGELRYWNPLLHEGEPLHMLPLGYPLDLLQALLPHEAGFSLTLAAHVPLAGLAFLALARELGCGFVAAAGGAVVYALGGFTLSSLNLYVYLQAEAWAPLLVLGLRRAAQHGGRWLGGAALVTAVAATTLGVEVVLQAAMLGIVLGLPRLERRAIARVASALLLGGGLAAPVLLPVAELVAGSARGVGLPTDVVVGHSVHPLSLPQVLIAAWHGNPSDLVNQWWGSNFFPLGFPYVLSLYLGAPALALAAAARRDSLSLRIACCLLAALAVAVGRWIGLEALVEVHPALRTFRFPVKAFFTVHACLALLTALGLDVLAREPGGRAWRRTAVVATLLGTALVGLQALPTLAPSATTWFLAGFLPPGYSGPLRSWVGELVTADAARGGALALMLGAVAVLGCVERLSPSVAAASATAILAGDLLRAGAGLNPTVTRSFFRLSPEMQEVRERLRAAGGRVFSCDPEFSAAYFEGRAFHREHDVWTFAVSLESFTPAFNVALGVPMALSRDLTMLVPEWRVSAPEQLEGDVAAILEHLREAGVAHVVCLQPLSHPQLRLRELARPARIAPLAVHVYDLLPRAPLRAVAREVRRARSREEAEALALAGLAGRSGVAVEGDVVEADDVEGGVRAIVEATDRIAIEATASAPSVLLLREAWAPGWEARVNGLEAPVYRANGRHRAVPIGAGRSVVELRYRPPGLRLGLLLAAAAASGAVSACWRRGPASEKRPDPATGGPA